MELSLQNLAAEVSELLRNSRCGQANIFPHTEVDSFRSRDFRVNFFSHHFTGFVDSHFPMVSLFVQSSCLRSMENKKETIFELLRRSCLKSARRGLLWIDVLVVFLVRRLERRLRSSMNHYEPIHVGYWKLDLSIPVIA